MGEASLIPDCYIIGGVVALVWFLTTNIAGSESKLILPFLLTA
jgi:hypothetical protein